MDNRDELWTKEDEKKLWEMVNAPADSKLSTKEMAEKLGRTVYAIYDKAYEMEKEKGQNITFGPKDQEEYKTYKYNKIINKKR